MSAQEHRLHSVDELVYVRLLLAIESHPRALGLLAEPTHTILIRIGMETFFVLYTIKSDILILLVDDAQPYDVTWEEDIAVGTQAVEDALNFFRDLRENHPEKLVAEHLDFVMSLRLLHDAFLASLEENITLGENSIQENLQSNSSADIQEDKRLTANILPRKRKKPLWGPRKEYLH